MACFAEEPGGFRLGVSDWVVAGPGQLMYRVRGLIASLKEIQDGRYRGLAR